LADTVTGTYTLGGTTTGTGPWNMTSTDSTYAVLRFIPTTPQPFNSFDSLIYGYDVNLGGIGGGAPRVAVVLDQDYDSDGFDDSFLIHWGPAGSFSDTTVADGLTTPNLLSLTDLGRYDLAGVGGSAYTDRAAALLAIGNVNVLRFSLIIDSFGGNDRDIDINSLEVQGLSMVPLPPAAWAGMSTLAGLIGFGAIRRRKHAVA
jgi:hypothetical protein